MAGSPTLPDYYAVLQVQPDADIEVISAAYRQLMKKYHPDVAGADPVQIAEHHRRSKEINAAFGVLRDPRRRKHYDEMRLRHGSRRPPAAPTEGRHTSVAPPPRPQTEPQPTPEPQPFTLIVDEPPSPYLAPFRLIAQAYYLLPGRYEWEPERRKELITVLMLPGIGTIGYCLATGRLAPLIGHTLTATLIVGAVLALSLLLMWQTLPRVAVAVVPMLAVVTGFLDPVLSQAHMPTWMAAGFLGCLSTFLAGRQFIFGVVPTVAICWVITHLA